MAILFPARINAFYVWLLRKLGFGEGNIIPRWLMAVLFPKRFIRDWLYSFGPIKWNIFEHSVTIYGIRFSAEVLRALKTKPNIKYLMWIEGDTMKIERYEND